MCKGKAMAMRGKRRCKVWYATRYQFGTCSHENDALTQAHSLVEAHTLSAQLFAFEASGNHNSTV